MNMVEIGRTNVLTRDTYYHAVNILQATLPQPSPDDPDARVCRDNAAMAEIAALAPVNADEVKLAVLYVVGGAHATDVLRAVSKGGSTGAEPTQKSIDQAIRMMRQAAGVRSLLLRAQAVRMKRDASNTATDAAAWTEHIALVHMGQKMGRAADWGPEDAPGAPPKQASMPATMALASCSET